MSAREPDRASRHDVDLLAPWAAIDRLDDADLVKLERLLSDNPALIGRLDFAVEERDQTVALNEALPTPSTAAREKLFAAIDAHEGTRSPRAAGVMAWLSDRLSALSPQTLAWGATAAALVIAVQTGLLTGGFLAPEASAPGAYQTASDGSAPAVAQGPTGLVAFQPTATAADVEKALRGAGAEIVGGPKPGGVFVVRVAGAATAQDLEPSLKRLRDAPEIVKFAVPGG